jgi:hypothetical protein
VFCFFFKKRGRILKRGYPKLITAAGGVRHSTVDPSIIHFSLSLDTRNQGGYSGSLNCVKFLFMLPYKDTPSATKTSHRSVARERRKILDSQLQLLASDWLVLRARSDVQRRRHCREAAFQAGSICAQPGSNLHSQLNKSLSMHADSAANIHWEPLFLKFSKIWSNQCVF